MSTNSISDLIYAFEIADEDLLIELYYQGSLNQSDIVKVSSYFVSNLPEYHGVNGNVWATMCGIIDDYQRNNNPLERKITDRQAVYLIGNLKRNIQERLPDLY